MSIRFFSNLIVFILFYEKNRELISLIIFDREASRHCVPKIALTLLLNLTQWQMVWFTPETFKNRQKYFELSRSRNEHVFCFLLK